MSEWVCTDSDSFQYCKRLDDFSFSFIEVRAIPDKYVVSYSVVDLRDYTLDEITERCSSFYPQLDTILGEYGFSYGFRVVGECIFESLDFDEMEMNFTRGTLEEAEAFVKEWVSQ